MTDALVHGIDRVTDDHLCGAGSGIGTDARNPGMRLSCPGCLLLLGRGAEQHEGDILRCVACGAPAVWRDGVPVNPGPTHQPPLCTDGRPHGPFIPHPRSEHD